MHVAANAAAIGSGGTQTPGNLFTAAQHPQLKQLAQRINAAAQLHFSSVASMGLPQEHPLNLFRPKAPMLHASWSIQAQAETYTGMCTQKVGTAVPATLRCQRF